MYAQHFYPLGKPRGVRAIIAWLQYMLWRRCTERLLRAAMGMDDRGRVTPDIAEAIISRMRWRMGVPKRN